MLQAKLLSAAHKIDNQRPPVIAVAIAAHDCDRRPDRAQLVQDSLRAHIAQVPDFVRIPCQPLDYRRKSIVRVGKDEYAQTASH